MSTERYTVRQCSEHGFVGIFLNNRRVTTTKCCGRWDRLLHDLPATSDVREHPTKEEV